MAQLSAQLIDVVRSRYGLAVCAASALLGGYDHWAESWRLDTDRGSLVLRVDRSIRSQTARWLSDVIARAARAGVPCQAPMPTIDGQPAVAFDDATILITAFTNGATLDRDDPVQVHAAGATLAHLHNALKGQTAPRPTPSPWDACFWPAEHDPPELCDRQLDSWHQAFISRASNDHRLGVVHGDFYAGNLIWNGQQVAAVIDWAEARIDAPARELAWATWEFGHDRDSQTLDIDRARTFLQGYHDVTGAWQPGLEQSLIPLMRVELRRNARYSLGDPGEIEYNSSLRRAFAGLRDQSALVLLEDSPSPQ
ncbi:MAG: phosphotransferase [Actinomycetota bacterium]|nr:phosphotransferase [Actinomycetota bacterium]